MSCPVLESLSEALAAVARLEVPVGLGADLVLAEQVPALLEAITFLQREAAVRMAAWERADPGGCDVRGAATQAGLDTSRARMLRRVGRFTAEHPTVRDALADGKLRLDQVDTLRAGAGKVPALRRRELVRQVLTVLPGLDEKESQEVVDFAVDQLAPSDPDDDEITDHAARKLSWATVPGGGITLEGYLPAPEAKAFTAALHALVESLRVAGDSLTPAQRRADALAALVTTATSNGLPTGGGLPAALTLTVSLTEATRIALRDPASHGTRITVRPKSSSTLNGGHPAGDAAVRFGICCAAITPILTDHPGPATPCPQPRAGTQDAGPIPDPREPLQPSTGGSTHPAGQAAAVSPPPQRAGAGMGGAPPGDVGAPAWAAGSLLARIATTPIAPLAVGRSVRLATTAQRQALCIRDNGCAITGCTIDAAYTQPHHVLGWAIGGTTDLDQLVSLCWVHHRMTELGRFRFQPRKEGEPQPPGAMEHPLWWIHPPVPVHT